MMYDFNDLSTDGIRNVLRDTGYNPDGTREVIISRAAALQDAGDIDEILFILEENGE